MIYQRSSNINPTSFSYFLLRYLYTKQGDKILTLFTINCVLNKLMVYNFEQKSSYFCEDYYEESGKALVFFI